MSDFKFRLRKILEHRITQENIRKGEFSKAQAQLNQEIKEKTQIINAKKNILQEKENISRTSTTMNQLQEYNNYLVDLDRKIEIQNKKIQAAQEEVEIARENLLESTKDKKIMEKLKQRDYEEHLYELKREEEKVIDQFVSYSSSTNVMGD